MNLFYLTVIFLCSTFIPVKSAAIPNKDILIRSDGLVVKNKATDKEMSDTIDVLTKISDDIEKSYRSVSSVTDFTKVELLGKAPASSGR